MVLDRDQKALDFIETFKIATSKQVSDIVYNNIDIANRRLKKLTDDKLLYRIYNPIGLGYVYSINKIKSTKQLRHKLLRNEFYFKLLELGVTITNILVEPQYGSLRPDMLVQFTYNYRNYAYLIEVECSNNTIDTNKYNNWWLMEYKQYLKVPIPVLYVTEKRVNKARYDYLKVKLSLSDIDSILR